MSKANTIVLGSSGTLTELDMTSSDTLGASGQVWLSQGLGPLTTSPDEIPVIVVESGPSFDDDLFLKTTAELTNTFNIAPSLPTTPPDLPQEGGLEPPLHRVNSGSTIALNRRRNRHDSLAASIKRDTVSPPFQLISSVVSETLAPPSSLTTLQKAVAGIVERHGIPEIDTEDIAEIRRKVEDVDANACKEFTVEILHLLISQFNNQNNRQRSSSLGRPPKPMHIRRSSLSSDTRGPSLVSTPLGHKASWSSRLSLPSLFEDSASEAGNTPGAGGTLISFETSFRSEKRASVQDVDTANVVELTETPSDVNLDEFRSSAFQSAGPIFQPTVLNQYIIFGHLGSGAHSTVFLAVHRETKELRAIKRLERQAESAEEAAHQTAEISIMRNLRHKHVLPLYEVINDPKCDHIFLVTQAARGPVVKFNERNRCSTVQERRLRRFMRQIANAVTYMHRHGVYHRDIKPDNILLSSSDDILIADFGVSELSNVASVSGARGTPAFMAPEALEVAAEAAKSKNPTALLDGGAIDMWAVGVTLFCMRYGYLPFDGGSLEELRQQTLQEPPLYPSNVELPWKLFFDWILHRDPKCRMRVHELKAHEFVQCNPPLTDHAAAVISRYCARLRARRTKVLPRKRGQSMTKPTPQQLTVTATPQMDPVTVEPADDIDPMKSIGSQASSNASAATMVTQVVREKAGSLRVGSSVLNASPVRNNANTIRRHRSQERQQSQQPSTSVAPPIMSALLFEREKFKSPPRDRSKTHVGLPKRDAKPRTLAPLPELHPSMGSSELASSPVYVMRSREVARTLESPKAKTPSPHRLTASPSPSGRQGMTPEPLAPIVRDLPPVIRSPSGKSPGHPSSGSGGGTAHISRNVFDKKFHFTR